MLEEVPKLPDEPQNASLSSKIAASKQSAILKNRLSRFFQQVNKFLGREVSPERKLSGRIRELESSADEIIAELLTLKNSLKNEANDRLFSLSCSLIDPIIKEITRIHKILDHPMSPAQQVKTFSRYVECIDKAKMWTNLNHTFLDVALVQDMVMTHTILEFHARIDRDLQVVQDYYDHFLNHSEIEDPIKRLLGEKIQPELIPLLERLEKLKHHPSDLSIDSFLEWREKANGVREKYFSSALHVIDSYLGERSQTPAMYKESEHSIELLSTIKRLEEKLYILANKLQSHDSGNPAIKQLCLEELDRLEEEVHALNGDLRLTQELGERVSASLEAISSLRGKL
jgi:hypothetical protein